ncbi:pyrimidine dimer DNA glycosylase/endonuclease V [Candidatus Woesearchaeota archaeon]|nr:pyrimidine dimer DNA glycosylase/endonuclease V [Candidatus Woesearchaeota archaeon]
MSRVNVGVNPKYLADQHLVAESVEITMIIGSLKANNFLIKSAIPTDFKLGKGHMNFFKKKITYLYNRLKEVNKEMINRGFNPGTNIQLQDIPEEFKNDWQPSQVDSNIIRNRICEKIVKKKNKFCRYYKENLDNNKLTKLIKNGELYFV